MRERLPVWVQARCGARLSSLAALCIVLLLGTALAAHHFWTGRPQPVSAPATAVSASPAPEAGEPPVPPVPTSSEPADRPIVVHVAGKVRKPGVHELPPGSRVGDALRAAGGVRPGTDTAGLNRARLLGDGEQVVVGAQPTPGAIPDATRSGPASGGRISLNAATAAQLETLPGIGPVLARNILDHRTEQGGFSSVEQLLDVTGIGERRLADLRDRVTR